MSNAPNIIFLFTDQQRWDALGCVNSTVKTPYLDKLASESVRYEQAVCQAPMCVPSRYSMMSGLYPFQVGVRNNGQSIPHESALPNVPLAEALRQRGYRTYGFGKTHWHDGRGANLPTARGFEKIWQPRSTNKNLYPDNAIIMSEDEPETYAAWEEEQRILPKGGESLEGYMGLRSQIPASHHREGWLTRKCLDELDVIDQDDDDRPLFLYLCLEFPHAGLYVPAEFEDMYDIDDIPDRPLAEWTKQAESHRPNGHIEGFHDKWDALTPEQRRLSTLRYYAATTYLDDCFRQVMEKMEALGMLENSLIVMSSDHGEMLGDRDHRYSKYCLYDGSVRVPLMVGGSRLPDELRGTVDHRPAELLDIYPTLTQAAGLEERPELPGRSLLGPPCRVGTFCEMDGAGGRFEPSQRAPALMWRTKEWKLIIHQQGSLGDAMLRPEDITGELYDLEKDPVELVNRYDDPELRDLREQLTLQLLMHRSNAAARFPRHFSVLGVGPNPPEEIGEVSPRYGVKYWY